MAKRKEPPEHSGGSSRFVSGSSIIAPAFFATLFELRPAAPWIALGLLNAVSIAGMLLLERSLPAAALRDPDEEAPLTA